MIKIRRNPEGSGNSQYFYVDDGDYLKPIHLIAKARSNDFPYEYYFFNDLELKGKKIVEFSFSSMGFTYARVYNGEDFDNEGVPKPNTGRMADPAQFCNRVYLDAPVVKSVTEYYFRYAPMADYVKQVLENKALFMGNGERIIEAIETGCPIGCIVQYRGSETCLAVVKRWVFSLWLSSLMLEAMDFKGVTSEFEGRPCIWVGQRGREPNFSFLSPYGEFTVWIEPPLYLTRPSLLVVRGRKSLDESLGKGVIIHIFNGLEGLEKIRDLFKPRALITVSVGDLPTEIGIGNLTARNEDSAGKFKEAVRGALKELQE